MTVRRVRVLILCLIGLLAVMGGRVLAVPLSDGRPVKSVLVFVSYHMTHPWTERLVAAMEEDTTETPYRLVFNVVVLDALRTRDPQDWEKRFLENLSMLKRGKYAAVVTIDDQALDLLLAHYAELPPEIPVVFAGYENYTPEMKIKYPNLTGVTQVYDIERTARTGLALYPNTRVLAVLTDYSIPSQEFKRKAQRELSGLDGVKVEYIDNSEYEISKVFEMLRALPEDSLVLLSPWRGVAANDYQSVEAFGLDLAGLTPRPYLVSTDDMIGFGALGGYIAIAEEDGRAAGRLLRRVLAAGSAKNIPVETGTAHPVFDYRELAATQRDFDALPPDAVLRNRPPSLWQAHREAIIGGLALVLMVLGGAVFWVWLLHRKMAHSRAIYAALPARVGIIARDERILFMNLDDFDDKTIQDAKYLRDVPHLDYEKVSGAIQSVFADGKRRTLDYESDIFQRTMVITPLAPEIFGEAAVIWVSHDNSELQNKRRQMAELLERYTLLLDNLPCYVTTKDVDDGYRYTSCNAACCQLLDCTPADIVGKTDFDLFANADEAAALRQGDEQCVAAGAQGGIMLSTGMITAQDGVRHYVSFYRKMVRGADGRQLLFELASDMTEVENARHCAEESAEWLRLTLNSIGDAVITTDTDGRVIMLNPVAERMIGVCQSEAKGRLHEEIFNIVSFEDEEPSPSPVYRALRTGKIVELANHTDLIARDGTRYHISDSAAPIFDAENNIIGAILVFHDVTEFYLQRDKLRAAAAQLESGSEMTGSASFEYNFETCKLSGSKLLPKLWPFRDGEPVPLNEWILPADLPRAVALWNEMRDGTKNSMTLEFRALRDGKLRYYRLKSMLGERRPDGMYSVGAIQDITEITMSMAKLREQQDLWNLVINSIPVMIFAKRADHDFRYMLTNRSFEEFVGKDSAEIAGRTDAEIFNRPGDAEAFRGWDQKIMENGTDEFFESPADAHGNVRSLRTTKIPFVDANGDRLLLGVSVDISKLDRMLRNERISNAVLRQTVLTDNYEEALDKIAAILLENLNCFRVILARLDESDHMVLAREWNDGAHRSLRELHLDVHQRLWTGVIPQLRAGKVIKVENLRSYYGAEVLFRDIPDYETTSVIGVPVMENHELRGLLMLSFAGADLTFDDSEEELMRSMAGIMEFARIRELQNRKIQHADHQRQMILDNINIPIWLFDRNGKVAQVNRSVCELVGLDLAAIQARPCYEVFGCKLGTQELCPVKQALHDGNAHQAVYVRSGRRYIINANPVSNADGQISGAIKTAVDVTELERLIREQKLLNFSLETLLREPDLKTAVEKVLEAVCRHFDASRCYAFRFDHESKTLNGVGEYVADGGAEVFGNVRKRPYFAKPNWETRLEKTPSFVIRDCQAVNADEYGTQWTDIVKTHQFRSMYVNRLSLRGRVWGYAALVFQDNICDLSESDLILLNSLVRFIDMILERGQAQQEILTALDRTRQSEAEKNMLLANEQVLNQGMSAVLNQENPSDAATPVLKAICTRLNAQRGYILRIDDEGKNMYPMFEYRMDLSAPSILDMPPVSLEESRFREGVTNFIYIGDVNRPEQAEHCRLVPEVNRTCGIRSIGMVGIEVGGKLWGDFGIAFGPEPHELTDDERKFLLAGIRLVQLMIQRNVSHAQLLDALEKAKAADRAKSFFLASVSHEIRTPLNAVIGFTELLKDNVIDEATRADYISSIQCSGNALLQLINDVLDLSKLEAGQMRIIAEPVHFRALAGEVMQVFSAQAAERRLALQLEIQPMPELLLDKLRVRQLLFNLIGNAVKFTLEGSITLNACFHPTGDGGGTLEFAVVDTGVGIAEKDQARLMEPFVQLSQMRGTNATNNGTGLGLSICRRLVERMGGEIRIKSEPGKGSSFNIILYKVAIRTESGTEASVTAAALPEAPVEDSFSVLLVDDVEMNLRVMKALFQRLGIRDVVAVLSGKNAWAELNRRSFNLVMTDLWMPEMNGAELAAQIRSDSRFANLPIVAVTADVESGNNFSMKNFSDVLMKPLTLDKIKLIVAALQMRREPSVS